MARLLVSCGADTDCSSAGGQSSVARGIGSSPMSFAVSAGKHELISFFHSQGASLDAPVDATTFHVPNSQKSGPSVCEPIRDQMAAVVSAHALHRAWCVSGRAHTLVEPPSAHAQATHPATLARRSSLLHCAVRQLVRHTMKWPARASFKLAPRAWCYARGPF